MKTLLLRLAGPMQSWSVDSNYNERRTQTEPTKSGVIGMIGAALGLSRGSSLDAFNNLRFGIRVDQPGVVKKEFQMVRHSQKTKKASELLLPYNHDTNRQTSTLTNKYYISDGIFLAGLESDDGTFLESIEYALKHPIYHLYLGRRSYPPTLPLVLGIRDLPLENALEKEPWLVDKEKQKKADKRLRIICETKNGEPYYAIQRDMPVSFNPENRMFTYRGLKEEYIKKNIIVNTQHNAFLRKKIT